MVSFPFQGPMTVYSRLWTWSSKIVSSHWIKHYRHALPMSKLQLAFFFNCSKKKCKTDWITFLKDDFSFWIKTHTSNGLTRDKYYGYLYFFLVTIASLEFQSRIKGKKWINITHRIPENFIIFMEHQYYKNRQCGKLSPNLLQIFFHNMFQGFI